MELRKGHAHQNSCYVQKPFNLLISCYNSSKETFIYYKLELQTIVSHARHGMRPIDHAAKSNFKEKIPVTRYFRLSEGLNRQNFYQNDVFQNDSSFALLFPGLYLFFRSDDRKNSCQPTLCLAYDFFVNSLIIWRNSS